MKIGIDVSPLQNGHKNRGTGSYVKLLLESLRTYITEHDFIEFTNSKTLPSGVDCLHFPYFDPFFLTLPWYESLPYVVTVHDLIPIAYAEHFPPGLKGQIKWQIQKKMLKNANHIITDSIASKKDIVSLTEVNASRVTSIPLAAAPMFQPVISETTLERVKNAYNLPQKFILYVGDINWNKNIPSMLHAIKQIELPLVLVGKAFTNSVTKERQEIEEIIEKESLDDRIVKLGFVPSDDLPAIYSLAETTLCLSYAEGFGFPALESMACGTSCVVSNCSSLIEIAGPSMLVDPENISDIVQGIKETLKDSSQARKQKNIAWANNFSWEKVAKDTANIYQNLYKNK